LKTNVRRRVVATVVDNVATTFGNVLREPFEKILY